MRHLCFAPVAPVSDALLVDFLVPANYLIIWNIFRLDHFCTVSSRGVNENYGYETPPQTSGGIIA
jgi:hypothetical protein